MHTHVIGWWRVREWRGGMGTKFFPPCWWFLEGEENERDRDRSARKWWCVMGGMAISLFSIFFEILVSTPKHDLGLS
jgi:hypothetical protein